MSRPAPAFGPAAVTACLAAATTWVALLSWRGFTDRPGTFLIPLVATSLDRLPSGTWHRTRSAGFVDTIARPLERRHVLEVVAAWARPLAGTPT